MHLRGPFLLALIQTIPESEHSRCMSNQPVDLGPAQRSFKLVHSGDAHISSGLLSRADRDQLEILQSRFERCGPDGLNDRDLLQLLLSAGSVRRDFGRTATDLLDEFGDLPGVLSADHSRLVRIAGEKPAFNLKLVAATGIRMAAKRVKSQPVITRWDTLIEYCRTTMAGLTHEVFHVLFLDRANRLISDERQGRGTVDHVPVYPREILKRALELDACALILVHNHPSGDPTPSQTDIDMTKMIQTAAESLSVTLHDHVIIGAARETSMVSEGLI